VFLCQLSPVFVWRDLGVCVIVDNLSNSFSIDGQRYMVTNFPHVEMLQYLFDNMGMLIIWGCSMKAMIIISPWHLGHTKGSTSRQRTAGRLQFSGSGVPGFFDLSHTHLHNFLVKKFKLITKTRRGESMKLNFHARFNLYQVG